MQQEGSYARWGQLLQNAEAAPDSQERILGVCRLTISFCTDILRPSTQFADKTTNILERHQVRRSQLGTQPLLTYLHVHEVCSYEDNISFWQPHAAAASKNVAKVQMVLQPAVSLKSNRFSSGSHVKIKLPGTCNIELGHDSYRVLLPKLLIRNPTGSSAEMELGGYLSIDCAATGLSLIMSFKDNTAVKGQVSRQLGLRRIPIAQISGKWSEQILVQCPAKQTNDSPLEGLLFDCQEYGGPIMRHIDPHSPGPMQLAGLWSCLYYAMHCSQDVSAVLNLPSSQGAAGVPAEKGRQSKGWFKKAAEPQAKRAEQDKGPVPEERPPCIQAEHNNGRQLHFALRCSIDEVGANAAVTSPGLQEAEHPGSG